MAFIRTHYIIDRVRDREAAAKGSRSFEEAISLAKLYAVASAEPDPYWDYENKAIGWLFQASRWKPFDVNLQDSIDLDVFFNSFKRLHCSYPFLEPPLPWVDKPMLGALKRNKTITELNLSNLPLDGLKKYNYINEHLVEYISETNSLKKIILNNFISTTRGDGLHARDMQLLARGLAVNSSLEEIDLRSPIGDEGLTYILEALANNRNTKFKIIRLLNTGITNKGANALIEFLKHNKTVVSVELFYNIPALDTDGNKNKISQELKIQIEQLLKINKLAKRTYIQGAMFGLFAQLNLPPELGWKSGKYLNVHDGRCVALSSQLAARIAREEEHKVRRLPG